MLNTQNLDNFQLSIVQQLINIKSQNIWQKVASLVTNHQHHTLINKVTFVKEKTDIKDIIQQYPKPELSKILGVLPKDEPLETWIEEIE